VEEQFIEDPTGQFFHAEFYIVAQLGVKKMKILNVLKCLLNTFTYLFSKSRHSVHLYWRLLLQHVVKTTATSVGRLFRRHTVSKSR